MTLVSEIEEIAKQYPESRSAIMPALHLAQKQYGWLPREAFEQVGEALGLTPAYCMSVASFYDMYHLEPVGTHTIEVVHVVEARDGHAVRGCQSERLADLFERLARQPAVLLLGEVQRRHDRRPRLGILLGDLLDLADERHRSVSPMTASSEPTVAIMSAMSESFMHVAVASSATNDGARKCTRHGFGPPSDTR